MAPINHAARTATYARDAEKVLRQLILDGAFRPGERLNEAQLSRSLGISRSPIREAFNRLANEGILELVPNRGAFVRRMDVRDVEELYEVREALEVMAVRLAARRATAEDLAALHQILSLTRLKLERQRADYPSNLDFHVRLIAAAGNEQLARRTAEVDQQLRLARELSGHGPQRADQLYDEHVALYEAMVARDADGAAHLMHVHLTRAMEAIRDVMVNPATPDAKAAG